MIAATTFLSSRGPDIPINQLLDVALVRRGNQRLVFSVSSQSARSATVRGGDIGWAAVCTTINHVAAAGARPIGVAVGLMMSEDFDARVAEQILESVADAARTAGVTLAVLDTELVPARDADEANLTAFAIGAAPRRPRVHPDYIAPRDTVVVASAPIVEPGHDVVPLNHLIEGVLKEVPGVIFVCDVSRGGMERAYRDVAARTGLHVRRDDDCVVPNMGELLFFVRSTNVDRALAVLRRDHSVVTRAVGRIEE
jgi:hydrogenase expression/formation protein HypE